MLHIWGKLVVLIFGLLVGFMLGELVVRSFLPQKLMRPCISSDPELAFNGVRDCAYLDDWTPEYYQYYVSLNAQGLRQERDLSQQDSQQILCLGDSFAFGMGVEVQHSFVGLLEKWLDKFNLTHQLVNAAYPAYSSGHSRRMQERLEQDFKFDKVIYFMYFNDLFDNVNQDINYRTHSYSIDTTGNALLKNELVYTPNKRLWHRFEVAEWLYKNSHLTILIKNVLKPQNRAFENNDPRIQQQLSLEKANEMIAVTIAHIEALAAACRAKQQELLLVYIPCWKELNLNNDYGWESNFPFQLFKSQLQNSLKTENLTMEFLDATKNMNASLNDNYPPYSTYYFEEGHFNEAGNLWFYNAVKEEILQFIVKK